VRRPGCGTAVRLTSRPDVRGYRPGTTGTGHGTGGYRAPGPAPTGPFGEEEAPRVATMEQCLKALDEILGPLASNPGAAGLDRSLSCRLSDLGQVVRGQLRSGEVRDLHVVPGSEDAPPADIRLTMTSDDLVALTDGRLSFGPAWASGRVKLEAGFRDLLRLRKLL
jgi:hypothetical protein